MKNIFLMLVIFLSVSGSKCSNENIKMIYCEEHDPNNLYKIDKKNEIVELTKATYLGEVIILNLDSTFSRNEIEWYDGRIYTKLDRKNLNLTQYAPMSRNEEKYHIPINKYCEIENYNYFNYKIIYQNLKKISKEIKAYYEDGNLF